jgi:hypothetical protein
VDAPLSLTAALSAPVAAVIAAGIAAVTSVLTTIVLRYFVEDKLMRRKAETDYRYEQRKALRQVLGTFDGPLVQAAEDLHNRMLNLYERHGEAELRRGTRGGGYYYRSTVYRFLAFYRLAVTFEQRALYLDPRIADATDLRSMRYVKALQWVMTDRGLFEGLDYDSSTATDHFFRDRLRAICDIDVPDGQSFDFGYFEAHVLGRHHFEAVHRFFDGLGPETTPFRWDRLVAMDLLLMAFMNSVGYDEMHRFTDAQIARVAGETRNEQVRVRMREWFIPEMKLEDDPQAARLLAALKPA